MLHSNINVLKTFKGDIYYVVKDKSRISLIKQ